MQLLLLIKRIAPDPLDECRKVHGPCLAGPLMTVLKNDDCGDASNVILCGETLFRFRIHLRYPDIRLKIGGCLFKNWPHFLAGAAPCGPEVNNERDLIGCDMPVKIKVGKLNRMSSEEMLLASSADGVMRESHFLQPVRTLAVRTNNVNHAVH
jgi:hypothetical protein